MSFVGSSSLDRRSSGQFIVRVCVYLSVRQGMYEPTGRHCGVLFIHTVEGGVREATQET